MQQEIAEQTNKNETPEGDPTTDVSISLGHIDEALFYDRKTNKRMSDFVERRTGEVLVSLAGGVAINALKAIAAHLES